MTPRLLGILGAAAALLAFDVPLDAQAQTVRQGGMRATGGFYTSPRRAPQVRGYVARRGGYSYAPEDVINTYGDGRTRFGSANFYRDPLLDRQSPAGPFDHGFFFDSGITRHGGESPYQN